jgi:hypothetical protein
LRWIDSRTENAVETSSVLFFGRDAIAYFYVRIAEVQTAEGKL